MNMEKKAKEFAKKAHEGQMRRDNKTPYFTHVEDVVNILKSFKMVNEREDIICAAYLHDVVEDTNISLKEILDEFGLEIANLVEELTHDSGMSDREYILDISNMTDDAKIIKLADLLSNLTDTASKKSNSFVSKRLTAIAIITATLSSNGVLKVDD